MLNLLEYYGVIGIDTISQMRPCIMIIYPTKFYYKILVAPRMHAMDKQSNKNNFVLIVRCYTCPHNKYLWHICNVTYAFYFWTSKIKHLLAYIYTYGKHIVFPLYTHLQIQPNFEQMFGNIQCIIRILYIYFTQRRETVLYYLDTLKFFLLLIT